MFSNKVLTIGSYYKPPRGGINEVLNNYDKFVFDKFYFIPNGGGRNILISYFRFAVLPFRLLYYFLFHPSIKIVHIHTPSYKPFIYSAYTAKLCRLFNKKVVMHMHGGGFKEFYESNKSFVNRELRKVDALIALSDSWAIFYRDIVGVKNVFVIPNIVAPPKKEKQTDHSILNLLFLGFICHEKGIFDLVELINEYQEEYRGKLILNIGGGKREEQSLRQYIIENNISDIINMCGWVSGKEKEHLLNITDVFILPSYKEGSPMSIIESMTYGLPILATNVGGIPELVSSGVNGYLFEPGNKNKMKEYIDRILYHRDCLTELGNASYKMGQKYLPMVAKEKLKKLYNSICSFN